MLSAGVITASFILFAYPTLIKRSVPFCILSVLLCVPCLVDGILQKVGILKDTEGNEMSFSGSINETASAWVNNDEEFKVFKEWTDACEYFERDKKRFDEIWNGERKNVKVYNLPSAIKSNIVHYSSDFDLEGISLKKYRSIRLKSFNFKNDKKLFFYQADDRNWLYYRIYASVLCYCYFIMLFRQSPFL